MSRDRFGLLVAGLLSAVACSAEVDADGDGFPRQVDCADDDPERFPGQEETCNRLDDDCDGTVDEGAEVTPLLPGEYGLGATHARIVPPTGGGVGRIAISPGDVSGDGGGDLVVLGWDDADRTHYSVFHSSFCSSELSTLNGNAIAWSWPDGVQAVGDVNGDGIDDLNIVNGIWFGPVEGDLADREADARVTWGPVDSAVAADFDGDGVQDLAVGHYYGGPEVQGMVAWHRGPISGDLTLEDATTVWGRQPEWGWFGATMTAIQTAEGATAYVGAINEPVGQGWGRVYELSGIPAEGQVDLSAALPLPEMFPDEPGSVGDALVTDGAGRLCIGTDWTPINRVVCGSAERLRAGEPELVVDSDEPNTTLGPYVAMSPNAVALGDPGTIVDETLSAGSVRVIGDPGEWRFEWSPDPTASHRSGEFGKGVALLPDPGGWTWLAVAAPGADNSAGAVYLFALATEP